MKSALILFAFLVGYVNGHACFIIPQQRGTLPASVFTTPGDDACLHVTDPPCGGVPSQIPTVSFKAGQNATVTVLKNLSHYYAPNPGNWQINLLQDSPTGIRVGGFLDSEEFKSLEKKDVYIYIPYNTGVGGATLQLIYQTNNPNAPANFYQCADIHITSS